MEENTKLSYHDKELLKKMTRLCDESIVDFETVLRKADVLGIVNLYFDEIISHIDDLVDELESPEVKVEIMLYLTELKAKFVIMRANAKAMLDYLERKA